ncbi:MAG: non-canonical purine NTP diphosphatase [Cyclobacteriaceae bacterium]
MKLCFATNNAHKLAEIRQMLGSQIEILSLDDIGHNEEIPEDHDTMEANSRQKAEFIKERYQIDCFADDSGLEVDSLDGAPGVYSARYAGPQKNDEDNIDKLLETMRDIEDRGAQFKAVVTLILGTDSHQFEGIIRGEILHERKGTDGFGYDPVFAPDGDTRSFAQFTADEKNEISHRGIAIKKLAEFLQLQK